MAKAAEAGRPVQGAKGITPLINLQHFNIIWGFTPDYMHCVLLGVARQMTEDWLSNVGEEYYIGAPQTVAVLDQRLCSIKPHSCMPRLPRSVSLRKYWKASEWQQWLLYFSLPCLEGLLPRQYLKHFALLVKGIALLLQDTVSLSDISVSTDCLVKFVVDMQFLYGEKNMTFNVHQLLHMAQSVLNQGPLWAHSCFAFESNIGQIKQLVTSAKGAPLQIVERLMMASNFRYLKASASPCTLKFLTKAGPSNSKGGLLLSKPRAVSDQLLHLVQDHVGNIVRGRVMEHDRVIVSPGVRFHMIATSFSSTAAPLAAAAGSIVPTAERFQWKRLALPMMPSSKGHQTATLLGTVLSKRRGAPRAHVAHGFSCTFNPSESLDKSWQSTSRTEAVEKHHLLQTEGKWPMRLQ
ncbi:hypothetical protein HPB51_005112 [Rhipicephalus microplus]|uniref:Uncharacterized protein n=1 Tax=Rhipicephalus microplus TaxID=6941 RepID=A0A9J6EML4_RHIMP|nr:hypothetical protein HPB51_005112 [Rhipicephalus microplus]